METNESRKSLALVVDDDPAICSLIQQILEGEGLEVRTAESAADARLLIEVSQVRPFDLMLLDVSMPGQTGWEFLESLRADGQQIPVIFLTAHQSVESRVKGLSLGADDYITKPFEPTEVVARVEAVLRRARSLPVLVMGDLTIDLARRIVARDGKRTDLSPKEFDVLVSLVDAKGGVVSKEDLLSGVWGLNLDPGTKVVEVQIARLRNKLGRREDALIETVIGQGYRIRLDNP